MSMLPEGIEVGEFHPFIQETPHSFTYYETNASVTEVQDPGSCIVLLRDNATGKIVGVRIECFDSIPRFNS